MPDSAEDEYFRGGPGSSTSHLGKRSRQQYLAGVIARAAELLPGQGPLTGFAFLNTLQALEGTPFIEGVTRAARLFGCQPFLTEDQYREKITPGRILSSDLEAVLRDELGAAGDRPVGPFSSRIQLRMAMLQHPVRLGPTEELRWFIAETNALCRLDRGVSPLTRKELLAQTRRWVMRTVCGDVAFREGPHRYERDPRLHVLLDDLVRRLGESTIEQWSEADWEMLTVQALWRLCRNGVHALDPREPRLLPALRHRDILFRLTGTDSDSLVHEVLIPFCQAFTDQGFARWPLPGRNLGFFGSFRELHRDSPTVSTHWRSGLAAEFARLESQKLSPLDSIAESLELLGVVEDEWDDYITLTMLSLRGWAGMLRQMEIREDRFTLAATPGTLIEFLCVRLLLDRLALSHVARSEFDYRGRLDRLREWLGPERIEPAPLSVEQRAFPLFKLAQVLGWSPPKLSQLSRAEWSALVNEVESFSTLERRKTFHLAYERRFRIRALDALSLKPSTPTERAAAPSFQAVFCIDAREESFRRHIEELAPTAETFGAAGFFGTPMYYRGVADAHFTALAPVGVQPRHWVIEDVVHPLEPSHRLRARTRRAIGATSHRVHLGSRSIAGGAILAAGLGVLASAPLVARVLFPRLTAGIRRTANRFMAPPAITRLRLERTAPSAGPKDEQIGFSVAEMADIAGQFLRDTGLTRAFAKLVFFVGHGATCLNNPHKSAYDCGACMGSNGGPNARALAAMLNDPRVRRILEARGLSIPDDTRFIGALHNTTTDTISFFDLDLLPRHSLNEALAVQELLQKACKRNASERCRRFYSAPLSLNDSAAHRHVEGRSEDLAQTRPEFGNATNAICIVGRRERTRGLFLDRRPFLVSYDPTVDDPSQTSLQRILGAVVPVCEGINLQYFFSHVDPGGWGSGSKLPHNVTGLLGVMDGAASDLRTGLPWQGVEIHEPMRLLMVVEAAPEALERVLKRNESIARIIRNGWVQLALLDPESSAIQVFENGRFAPYQPECRELPHAGSSADWYRGWREHLPFAVIDPSPQATSGSQPRATTA